MKRPIATRIGTNDLDIYNEVVTQDCYGLKSISTKFTEKRIKVVDIGAHIGCFAYAITEHLRNVKEITYIGYEPYVPNYRLLCTNTGFISEHSPYTEDIFLYEVNAAVTGAKQDVRLESVDGFNTGMVVYKQCYRDETTVKSVDIVKALSFTKDHQVDLLKLDCEGAEELFFEEIPIERVRNMVGEYHSNGFMQRLVEVFGDSKEYNLKIMPSPTNIHQGIFKLFSI